MEDKINKYIGVKNEYIIEYICSITKQPIKESIQGSTVDEAKLKFRKWNPFDEIKSIRKHEQKK